MNMNNRNQNWGDDLRLPTLVEPVSIMSTLEPLRRISHPFQNRHLPVLKRGSWFALKRPADRSRTGLLCLWPERAAAIFVGSDRNRMSRVALLRLRVDPQFYAAGAGLTVFAATLCPTARELLVEDVLMWKGDDVANSMTFCKRFALLNRWIDHYCEADARLLGGVQVKAANWQPLDVVTPDGVWEFQQDDAGRKRLMWLPGNPKQHSEPIQKESAQLLQQPHSIDDVTPAITVGALVAIATKGSGPDQWNLQTADGVSLGRALIRTLDVSSALRSCGSTTAHLEVEWNSVFDKWEARAVTTAAAVPNAFFSVQK